MSATDQTDAVGTDKRMGLSSVAVGKPDGRVFVYYVLPSLPWWNLRLRMIRAKGYRALRLENERDPSVTYQAFIEYTDKRGWTPCPPL